jgi:hypothetical protein
MEEDMTRLFGAKQPYECPPRPADKLNLATFQVHLVRLSAFIDDVKRLFRAYQYLVSWENPTVTGLSFILFLRFCERFNPAYMGNVPFFFLLVWMLYLAYSRRRGRLKRKLLRKVVENLRKVRRHSNGPSVKLTGLLLPTERQS